MTSLCSPIRHLGRALRPALPLLSLLAACDPSSPRLGARQSAVINGVTDTGHPAVALLSQAGMDCCTATLVGSKTMLTAAHCLTDNDAPPYKLIEPFTFEIGGQTYDGASAVVHPSYDGYWLSNDVGVVRLTKPVTGVTPALAASAAPAMQEPITVVGFGYSKDGVDSTFGTKRKADNTIAVVDANEFGYDIGAKLGSLGDGDSGGPTFAVRGGTEYVIGVHSYDDEGKSHDQRVDAYLAWVTAQAQGDLYQGPAKDQSPPSVKIVAPADGAELGPSFTVKVSAQDDVAVARVELLVDGGLLETLSAAPYDFQVLALAPGAHAIQADAVDTANQRASASIHVQVASPAVDGAPAVVPDAASWVSGDGGGGVHEPPATPGSGGCSTGRAPAGRAPLLPLLMALLVATGWRRRRPAPPRG